MLTFRLLLFVMCLGQVSYLNPYPAERSVLVLDNAVIHKTPALEALVHSAGALVMWLP